MSCPTNLAWKGHGGRLPGFGSFICPARSCSLSALPRDGRGLNLSPASRSHGSAQTHGVGWDGASPAAEARSCRARTRRATRIASRGVFFR